MIKHALNNSLLLELWQGMAGQYARVFEVQLPWHGAPTAKGCTPLPPPMQTEGGQAGYRLHGAHFSTGKPQSLAEARDPGKEKPEPRGVQ